MWTSSALTRMLATISMLALMPHGMTGVSAAETAPGAADLTIGNTTLPTKAEVDALAQQAQAWLLSQQKANGSFVPGHSFAVGLTGLVVQTLSTEPDAVPATDPHITKALAFLETFRQKDGGFYDPSEGLGDYGTSLTMLALLATKTGDATTITAAQRYLFGIQNVDPQDPAKGGIGYGDDGKGDENLETTQLTVRTLIESGVPISDPHIQEAFKFLQRCQNLSSVNDQKWARNAKPEDVGGAAYSPKESKGGGSDETPDGERIAAAQAATGSLKSYGGMTYTLISSYLALNLKPTDERVAAALNWVENNYRFDANPGMRPAAMRDGLFYYYGMMSRTFDLLKITSFTTKDGKTVDWRADLFHAIKAQAQPGSGGVGTMWVNSSRRWGEQMPNITTTYMLAALKHISATL
jgi:hypothetical protein